MKPQIKNLARLIQLALQNDKENPVSGTEISNALDALETALLRLPCLSIRPVSAEKNLHLASSTLSNLVYNLGNGSFGKNSINIKMLITRANILYNEVNAYIGHYHPEWIPGQVRCNLQPFNSFFKTATKVARLLQEALPEDDLCKLLLSCLLVQKTKTMPFHRWLWWSQFFALFTNGNGHGIPPLEDVLTVLNFNIPAYIKRLRENLKKELLQKETIEEKLEYLTDLRLKYELMLSRRQFVFNPRGSSVKRSLVRIIKAETRNIQVIARQVQMKVPGRKPDKIGTTFSVPQLALFVRLMVELKIINPESLSAVLKDVAAIVSTPKTASISPESLRINYYTHDKVTINAVKDYLINMVNHLRKY